MLYPYKYPEVYAELARRGLTKRSLAQELEITSAGLNYKQTVGDFTGSEMTATAKYLQRPVSELFRLDIAN